MREKDTEDKAKLIGTPEALSPELLEAGCEQGRTTDYPYGFPSDMWATGCAMFAAFSEFDLVLERLGPSRLQDLQAQQQNAVKNFDFCMGRIAVRKSLGESSAFILFRKTLKGMLTLDPSERLTPEAGMALFLESRPLPFLV